MPPGTPSSTKDHDPSAAVLTDADQPVEHPVRVTETVVRLTAAPPDDSAPATVTDEPATAPAGEIAVRAVGARATVVEVESLDDA